MCSFVFLFFFSSFPQDQYSSSLSFHPLYFFTFFFSSSKFPFLLDLLQASLCLSFSPSLHYLFSFIPLSIILLSFLTSSIFIQLFYFLSSTNLFTPSSVFANFQKSLSLPSSIRHQIFLFLSLLSPYLPTSSYLPPNPFLSLLSPLLLPPSQPPHPLFPPSVR